jgi:hypothetical protein
MKKQKAIKSQAGLKITMISKANNLLRYEYRKGLSL